MGTKPKRFGITLRDLLLEREEYLTSGGNVNLQTFARSLPSYHYETLRKAVTGERQPTTELLEEVATVLGVPPETFYEYGLLVAQRDFDVSVVGVDEALENLERWVEIRGVARRRGGRGRGRRVVPNSV
jgi:transcriptional regulator with XRE-family HTH domain